MSEQQQQVFSDRYEMVKHIARGGMAQVYLARDLLLDRPVALKVLFPEELSVDRSFVERFRREAKAAANLTHPNIVSVFDWGQGEHTYFIVLEYVDGQTLSSILRQGPLDPVRAATVAASVAAALDFAHRRGVIHRDVKPGNVLIDERGEVKVADFGIARAVGTSEDLTQTGSVMGTATYFSPEQAQGYPVDARSDVYSLGVVLYEMACAKAPFTGDSPVSIAYKHVKEEAPTPSSINPSVPPDLEAIIVKAMAKDPAERYQSAEDLRADLLRFTGGQPVAAAAEATRVVPAAATLAGGAGTVVMDRVGGDPAVVGGAARTGGGWGEGGGTAVMATTMGRGAYTGAPPPPPEEPRPWIWVLAVLLLIALGVGGFLGGRAAGWWGGSVKNVTVPSDLVNKPQATAESELQRLGFSDIKTQGQNDSQVQSGNVIKSAPAAGTVMKSNQPITLVISAGAVQVPVPNVVGQPAATAAKTLQSDGFVVNQTAANSSTVAQGVVISTSPGPGSKAAQGAAIKMVVSSGKQMVTIPSLVGQSALAAGQELGALNLVISSAQEASPSVQAGEVTRTDPPALSSVPVGSTVTVYVSTGPPQVQVPDLSEDTMQQASAALTGVGLKATFNTEAVGDQSQDGKVQSQSPAPGSTIGQGSTVTVIIGQYTPSATSTTTTVPSGATTTSLP